MGRVGPFGARGEAGLEGRARDGDRVRVGVDAVGRGGWGRELEVPGTPGEDGGGVEGGFEGEREGGVDEGGGGEGGGGDEGRGGDADWVGEVGRDVGFGVVGRGCGAEEGDDAHGEVVAVDEGDVVEGLG